MKGNLKQIPELLIVNGPGTCVVVVMAYKLLKASDYLDQCL